MKRTLALLLVFVMIFAFAACGSETKEGESNTDVNIEQTPTKEDLLNEATPLSGADGYKAINNKVFAKSLIGNTFLFEGVVQSVEDEYAMIKFTIIYEEKNIDLYYWNIVGDVYLSLSELSSLEVSQKFSFVGKLSEVKYFDKDEGNGTKTFTELVFGTATIVSDRFEKTGILDSSNDSYGNNSWNIKFPNNNNLGLVFFREDVSAYKGKEITYSFKVIHGKCVDAYIVG